MNTTGRRFKSSSALGASAPPPYRAASMFLAAVSAALNLVLANTAATSLFARSNTTCGPPPKAFHLLARDVHGDGHPISINFPLEFSYEYGLKLRLYASAEQPYDIYSTDTFTYDTTYHHIQIYHTTRTSPEEMPILFRSGPVFQSTWITLSDLTAFDLAVGGDIKYGCLNYQSAYRDTKVEGFYVGNAMMFQWYLCNGTASDETLSRKLLYNDAAKDGVPCVEVNLVAVPAE